ncbi:MAG: TIGR00341 family protein [Bacillota bacterium]
MLRKIEIVLPTDSTDRLTEILDDYEVLDKHHISLLKDKSLYLLTLNVEKSGPLLDELEKTFSNVENFRLNMFEVEATLPAVKKEEKEEEEETTPSETRTEDEQEEEKNSKGLSRQEIYTDISDSINLNQSFLIMTILSAIVASSGVLQDNVAVIVGAMVIAPLLGPNVGLALASTLGDLDLGKMALKAAAAGTLAAIIVALLAGFILQPSEWGHEVLSRTSVGWSDITLALASGSAGTLAFTTGAAGAVIGVMIAVALIPPLVVVGLLAGAGDFVLAGGALLLFISNIVCINLAGVLTFIYQGISPLNWWEEKKAKKSTRFSLLIWIGLLLLIIVTIQLVQ